MLSKHEKTAIIIAAAILTLFVVITGPSLGWPISVWLPIGLLPSAAALLLARTIPRKREQHRMREEFQKTSMSPPPPPEPERPRQETLSNVSLRSAVPDYRFLLSATVYWLPNPNSQCMAHGNPGALAREAIVARAAEVLADEQPDEHSALTERLNAVLGTVLPVPPGQIEAWGQSISVTLPEADKKRLHRLAEVRKEEEVWEHERHHERNVREYLGDDVLRNPGRAVVWWLSRHNEADDAGLHTTVENIEDLRSLTSAAHATEIPEWKPPEPVASEPTPPGTDSLGMMPEYAFHTSGEDGQSQPTFVVDREASLRREESPTQHLLAFVDETVTNSEDDERTMFVRRMARLLDKHGQHDAATALRQRFGVDSYTTSETTSEPASSETDDSTVGPRPYGPGEHGQV